MRHMRRVWLVVACASFALASQVEAQISVFPRQNLSFGTLTPGVAEWVSPTDATRRAEVELVGSGNFTVLVEVPTVLKSASAGDMPVTFAAGDGVLKWAKSNRSTSFTPGQAVDVRIPPGIGGAYVWIGGAAQPSSNQRPGDYAGVITVRIMTAGT